MWIKWKYDVQLHVVSNFNEETETPDESLETFKQNTSSNVDIIEDKREFVDMQFGDGSIAFNVSKDMYTVEVEDELCRLIFVYKNKIYELVEADMNLKAEFDGYGYDIYEEGYDDPINMGCIAYFNDEPDSAAFRLWMDNFMVETERL